MAAQDPGRFLAELPIISDFAAVADTERYAPLPNGWFLALGDVIDSTGAIVRGDYKSVNLAGAAVISSVLNALGRHDLPFAFGGDGGVVAIPPGQEAIARQALSRLRRWAVAELGLRLRAALVPVTAVRAAGQEVRLARFRASDRVSYTMFAGGGSDWAEREMKRGAYGIAMAAEGEAPDLTGLSCRWDEVPAQNGTIVSLIVLPLGLAGPNFTALVRDVVRLAAEGERAGHPLPAEGPEPKFSWQGFRAEGRMHRPGLPRLLATLRAAVASGLVFALYRLRLPLGRFDARRYARDVGENSDFRKFDDGLKMTLDIREVALSRIETRLHQAAGRGICRYGLYRQRTALLTCLVPTPRARDHIHFVDGASGGYAMAARQIKDQRSGVVA